MTLMIRSAKSGSDWTYNELDAYNIKIRNQPAKVFFGQDFPATLTDIDPEFLTAKVPADATSQDTQRLVTYLDLATKANAGQESAVDDFARELLRMLGYEERGTILRTRYAIPLNICGEPSRSAQTDICLLHHASTIFLLVQEDKTISSVKDPEAQMVAQSIAAFQENNRNRIRLGKTRKDSMSIPCITMVGTRPIFYVVPVTQQLCTAVEQGQHPGQATEVRKCVVGAETQLSDGMERLDFRLEALKHYVLFRSLAKGLLSDILAD